jgi:hypothetical protein
VTVDALLKLLARVDLALDIPIQARSSLGDATREARRYSAAQGLFRGCDHEGRQSRSLVAALA